MVIPWSEIPHFIESFNELGKTGSDFHGQNDHLE